MGWEMDFAKVLGNRPETMGAVCAVVYLMCMIVFLPFAFYEYFVTSTSGGGNRDATAEGVETGRLLHKFPHNKVTLFCPGVRDCF